MIYQLKQTVHQSEQTKTNSKPTFHEQKRLLHFVEKNISHTIRTQLMLNSPNSPEDLELYDKGVAFGYLARYHGLKKYLKSIGMSSVSIKDNYEISWFFPDSIRIHLMSLYIYSKDIPLERPSRKQLKNKSFQEGYIWALKSLPKIYNEWSRRKGLTDSVYLTENVLFILENLDYPFLNDPIFQEFISNVKGKIGCNINNQKEKTATQDANKQKLLTFIKNKIPQPEENFDPNYNKLFKEGYAYGYIHFFYYAVIKSPAKFNIYIDKTLDLFWILDKDVSKLIYLPKDDTNVTRFDLGKIMDIPNPIQLDSSAFLKGYMKAILDLPFIFQEWWNIIKADIKIPLHPNVVIISTMRHLPCGEDNDFKRFISVLEKILPSKCNCLDIRHSYRLPENFKCLLVELKKIKGYDYYKARSEYLKNNNFPSEEVTHIDITIKQY